MKTIAYVLIAVLLVYCSKPITAQESDRRSRVILDELSERAKSYETLKIDFVYIMENRIENIKETINGTIYMKGDKYALQFGEQLIVCDGITVWTYLESVNEVQIGTFEKDSDESITINNIFTLYKTGHRSRYIRVGQYNGKDVHVIELVPTDQRGYHKVRLNIDLVSNDLVSAVVFDRNQNTFTYEIKSFSPNISIPPERFTFNVSDYPGIEIIDLR